MADIDYQHAHTLGLDKARELALQWMNEGAQQLGLNCQHTPGEAQDTITFERMGVKGTMVVSGTNFDLKVKLGMMMAAFKPMIEAELARNMARLAAQTGTSSDQA
jgi:putative polyhydroxyalkanoate system protein